VTVTEPPVADEDRLPPKPSRRAHLTPLGKLIIFLLLILAPLGAFAGYAVKVSKGSDTGREVSVVIQAGSSASHIAKQLESAGVIRAAWLFRLYSRLHGTAGALKPGEYVFHADMSYGDVIAILEKGPKIVITRVTIPEGKTVRETALIFERVAGIPASAFLAEATNGKHTTSILPRGSRNLEGVLFPKTYDLKEGTTPGEVVDMMLRQFEKETAPLNLNARASKLGVTPYEAIVIASMIEREAKVAKDRGKVSRVIYNRLARHMRLQIDATVQYGIYRKTGSYKNPLLVSDYTFASPYNTYLIDGLPPGPIANPGLAAIQAALDPTPGKWLYYVLINDKGEHAFANTFAEFQQLLNSRR
jgi:peptidoglycan lytic transglycosylase G